MLQVTVSGKQWWWQFTLPQQPLVGERAADRVVTSTELHIPVNTKVFVRLQSDNVIHSFWVPELTGKKDVMPSRTNTPHDRGRATRAPTSACARSTAGSRTPTCGSA